MKKLLISIGSLIVLFVLAFTIWHWSQTESIVPTQNVTINFKGNILAITHADMVAGAYANGELNKVKGIEDKLALLSGINGNLALTSSLEVSNSVISWPAIPKWNGTNKLAYVAETRAPHEEPSQKMDNVFVDFNVGKKITVIDYKDPKKPVIFQEKEVGQNLQGVSINKDRTLLVSGSTEEGKEIVIMRLENGLIDNSFYFSNPNIDSGDKGNGGIRTIEFHPTKNIIAANLNNTHLVFYEIVDKGLSIEIKQIGEPISVGKRWSVGNWHPSGNFFILSDVAWGDGLEQITHGKGALVSVVFNDNGNHNIISKVKVGLSPEGFDISPDGNYAVTVNMRRTWAPKNGFWFVPAKKTSSLFLNKNKSENG